MADERGAWEQGRGGSRGEAEPGSYGRGCLMKPRMKKELTVLAVAVGRRRQPF